MPHPIVAEDLERVLVTDLPWEQLHGKAVLVTGANGFLPAYMVRTLVALNRRDPAADIRITALCRSEQRAMARFGQEVERGELTLLIQDVCDPVELDGDLDIIIHAASNASPRYYDTDPIGTLSANVFGTAGLLRLAADRQIDCFFFFSSPDVYGEVSSFPISEGDYGVADPLALRRCYGESKRMAENMLVSWHHQHGVPFKLVRPFHVYGPGFALDDGRVFADFVGDVVAGRDIVLNSDGLARRTFCYLSDATTAFFTVLLRGEWGTPYNVSNHEGEISIRDLADLCAGLFPELGLEAVYQKPDKTSLASASLRGHPDIDRLRALGYEPQVGLEEGFRRTIRSYL